MLRRLIEELESEEIPVFSDSVLKKKLYDAALPIAKGFFNDNSWKPIHDIQAALQKVLPAIVLYDSRYDFKNRPPQYKDWLMVGGFVNKQGKKRVAWASIRASGAGSVEDPLGRYDVTVVVEILSPNNVEHKAQEYLKGIGFLD